MELLKQKIVDLSKQIQELKVKINHMSSAQGEEAEIQYNITVEKLKSVRLELMQGTGISRPGINFIVKVRFLASYWHGHLGPWAHWIGPDGPQNIEV